jgi:cyclic dehypoxanthinyl futalosine synthase
MARIDASGRLTARIGTVSYLNAQPLVDALEGYPIWRGHPSEIARRLAEGEVDLALVPVAAVLAGSPDLRIVPGFCIGADGPVGSVLLVAETEPEAWTEVVLDGVSRTSVILAQLLLRRGPLAARVRSDLRIVDGAPGTGVARAGGTVASVVIGDVARALPERLTVRIDLAAAWKEWTKLPFVFAVWAGHADLDPGVLGAVRDAGRRGVEAIAARYTGDDLRYLTENLRYPLDERALMGLRRFAALAKQEGLLPSDEVRLYSPPIRLARRALDLDTLLSKGASGERLSFDEGVRLDREASISDLGAAADLRKQMLHPGDNVTYIVSRNINYTNVCVTACKFCAFYRPKRHGEAYVLTRDQMAQKIQETVDCGGIEILLQGGLHPELGIGWYEDLFRWVKQNWPGIALHALSPEEIYHIMAVSQLSLRETLERLIAAGMDSIPGGGAEVLDDEIRKKIAPLKATSQEWLDCMEEAHRLGLRSSSTMMFGVGETSVHRVRHFDRLRAVQDRTGGFTAFICWTFVPDNTYVKPAGNTGADYLRTNALARLYLDNIRNLQASWVTQGPGLAQASLHMGCNDYGSVMLEENVVSAAGNTWSLTLDDLERNIREAGFVPVRRNMRYQRVVGSTVAGDGAVPAAK